MLHLINLTCVNSKKQNTDIFIYYAFKDIRTILPITSLYYTYI